MNPDEPPMQRVWSCLLAIHCDAVFAQNNCSNIMNELPIMLGSLTPLSKQKLITDDLTTFEKQIETLEYAAANAADDLLEIPHYTKLIRGALDEMKKEAGNE